MNSQPYVNSPGLTVKDLVTTGIFSALLWITMLLGGLPLAPNPFTTFYMPLGSALLGGPVFMLLAAKVPKRGPISIAGILIGSIWFITGMHWAMDLGYVLCGIAADLIAGIRKYRSVKLNILAYACLSLGPTGTYISYFADPASWGSYMLEGGTSAGYIEAMNGAAQDWMLAFIILGTLAVALFSGWVGSRLLRKQFEKAGITA